MNYRTEAGLYHPLKRSLKPSPAPIVCKRFKTAAAAIRFTIEQLPSALLAAASLEVGDHRYDAQQIRELYDASAYPLKRHSRRNAAADPSSTAAVDALASGHALEAEPDSSDLAA